MDPYKDPVLQPRKFFLSPFPALCLTNILNHGGEAVVLAFPGSIVLKCPIQWGYSGELPVKAIKSAHVREQVAQQSMSIEKKIFTLEDRVVGYRDLHYPECHASDDLKRKWASQIVSAAAWRETLGYSNGDITPRNILLDNHNSVKLSDLGETVPVGGESQCGCPPYVPSRSCLRRATIEANSTRSDGHFTIFTIFTVMFPAIGSDRIQLRPLATFSFLQWVSSHWGQSFNNAGTYNIIPYRHLTLLCKSSSPHESSSQLDYSYALGEMRKPLWRVTK
ncbi:hypothetical protein AJ80_04067 [Polytolypa hystricis UAMH7299]|uniref:Protein kinase domain-containing protein n=1 Tax=Polytolypa hystricis (strain UAMH7299) TaxID=1447883 RepID=A0A2B7Y583_POLH7|nr:hypothetical protein AJ80_04067 [Polytolypa hystricis UAMH7299]